MPCPKCSRPTPPITQNRTLTDHAGRPWHLNCAAASLATYPNYDKTPSNYWPSNARKIDDLSGGESDALRDYYSALVESPTIAARLRLREQRGASGRARRVLRKLRSHLAERIHRTRPSAGGADRLIEFDGKQYKAIEVSRTYGTPPSDEGQR